ncbi:very short patch repair endonuclease [Zhihengliuella sp. ISTPL4]|uniref:very short patch repair endonuclease n=1 Tax=Zhihengliuella sp. ISTPL4 TaxID=2058657 RepID=UPI002570ECDE|nr:very short patch repair endonuclease [Zhihengliuella sp. ISTPL4]
MRANRGRDTGPEMLVRRLVHRSGLRYRVSARPERDLRRTADLLFRRARVAVFLDGCFWHGCPDHHQSPKSNATFWSDKVAANRARDADTTRVLSERGWSVVRIWEHEIRTDAHDVAARIVKEVRRRRSPDPLPEKGVENGTEESGHVSAPDDESPVE